MHLTHSTWVFPLFVLVLGLPTVPQTTSDPSPHTSYHIPGTNILLNLSTPIRGSTFGVTEFNNFIPHAREVLHVQAIDSGGLGFPLDVGGFRLLKSTMVLVIQGIDGQFWDWPSWQDADCVLVGLAAAVPWRNYRESLFDVHWWSTESGSGERFGSGWILRRYGSGGSTRIEDREGIEETVD